MITNLSDLRNYISYDMKANGYGNPNKLRRYLRYKLNLLLGFESAVVCKYLRVLRRYEFFINCKSNFITTVLREYYNIRHSKLSLKYSIRIWPNSVEYGLRIPHICGGGDYQCFTSWKELYSELWSGNWKQIIPRKSSRYW